MKKVTLEFSESEIATHARCFAILANICQDAEEAISILDTRIRTLEEERWALEVKKDKTEEVMAFIENQMLNLKEVLNDENIG